jgi:hypothetical protein
MPSLGLDVVPLLLTLVSAVTEGFLLLLLLQTFEIRAKILQKAKIES